MSGGRQCGGALVMNEYEPIFQSLTRPKSTRTWGGVGARTAPTSFGRAGRPSMSYVGPRVRRWLNGSGLARVRAHALVGFQLLPPKIAWPGDRRPDGRWRNKEVRRDSHNNRLSSAPAPTICETRPPIWPVCAPAPAARPGDNWAPWSRSSRRNRRIAARLRCGGVLAQRCLGAQSGGANCMTGTSQAASQLAD